MKELVSPTMKEKITPVYLWVIIGYTDAEKSFIEKEGGKKQD